MPRHLVQNSRYTFIANSTAARDELLNAMLFGMREISNDEFNQQLAETGEEPVFVQSDNFDATVWEH